MATITEETKPMTAPNEEKRDEIEELYRDIGGEG